MTNPPCGIKISIVPLHRRHLDQVVSLENASFPQPWPAEIFLAEMKHPRALVLAALTLPSEQLAGYMCLWIEKQVVQVQNLAVNPAFRRRGVGRRLLLQGLEEAKRRGAKLASLEVRPSNLAARRLYASAGFTTLGTRPGYYQPEGEDALLLGRRLDLVLNNDIK